MSEGRGVSGAGLWAVVLCLVFVFACIFAPLVIYGIEDSRSNRAQAKASAEQSKLAAVAAQAKAEVEKVEAKQEGELNQMVERYRYELERARLSHEQFQERVIILAMIIEGMNEEELARLEDQLNGRGQIRDVWLAASAGLAAPIVFLMGLSLWARLRRRSRL